MEIVNIGIKFALGFIACIIGINIFLLALQAIIYIVCYIINKFR